MSRRGKAAGLVCFLLALAPTAARGGMESTLHNLSPGGPGRVGLEASAAAQAKRSKDKSGEICVYCHTPHNTAGARGLWNHELSPVTYTLYESSTTEAELQQPTGASRLCLSCHDGRIAVGALRRGGDPSLGRMKGRGVLGTDLSDDHPISFVYDLTLTTRRQGLADPTSLEGAVRLDDTGQMQCTSCHDPHLSTYGHFLVSEFSHSRLCVVCHRIEAWDASAHATSDATGRAAAALPGWGFGTVAENGCSSCHQSHNAEQPARLLRGANEDDTCLPCHDASVAKYDIRRQILNRSAHRGDLHARLHDPTEDPLRMARHVACVDCHNPHRTGGRATGLDALGSLSGVSGLSVGGSLLREATFAYEICLKCHGVAEAIRPVVTRADNVTNTRLEIDPSNASFHPLASTGRNQNVPSLIPPLNVTSQITCTSCHSDDSGPRGGTPRARGPHGSTYAPILAAEYRLEGIVGPESYQYFALCYQCHNRDILLNDSRGVFPHRLHVDDLGASCAACHDAHGSRNSAHLINFMTRDVTGTLVATESSSGLLEYQSTSPGSGRCYLTCHGKDHDGTEYPVSATAAARSRSEARRGIGAGFRPATGR